MKKVIRIVAILLLLLPLAGCEKPEPTPNPNPSPNPTPTPQPAASITLSIPAGSPLTQTTDGNATGEMAAAGGTVTVPFSATVAWTVSTNSSSWCSITPASGSAGSVQITLTVAKNDSFNDREATVVIVAGGVKRIITLKQLLDPNLAENVPSDQIWYTTWDKKPLELKPSFFDRAIKSNTYQDGKGVILFDGPVTRIGDGSETVFGRYVMSLYLPNSVERIETNAIRETMLTSFRAPDKLKYTGENFLMFSNYLERLHGKCATEDETALILDGTMVAYALGNIQEKETLVVPAGAKALAPSLFQGQYSLREVILPDGLESIGFACFAICTKLESVTFPASFKSLDRNAFFSSYNLKEFKGDCPYVVDGRMFIDADGVMVDYAGVGATECVVPEGIKEIGPNCFIQNKTLQSLTLPATLTTVYTSWLLGCDQLEYVYGPVTTEDHHCVVLDGVYLIGVTPHLPVEYTVPEGINNSYVRVFEGIQTTERITLPETMTHLGDAAFMDMPNLRTVVIPSNMSNLGTDAFRGAAKLDSIIFRSYTPPAYEEFSYYTEPGIPKGTVIMVPEGTESLYQRSASWSRYADRVKGYQEGSLVPPDYYMSRDYSQDGVVTVLQKASKGKGIDIVLLGDAFSDRQIADGTYLSVMKEMADSYFSVEPYKSYRDLFNVYAVNVVSATEGYDHAGQALGTWFGFITNVGGSDAACIGYARKAVSDDRMDNTLIIVAMNDHSGRIGGTCYMMDPENKDTDYGCGTSVAYFALGTSSDQLSELIHHEAGGHGFAKLADEYAYEEYGTIDSGIVGQYHEREKFGWWKNVDFTGDPAQVKWARFLSDERYRYDGLGVFEGACTYWKGAWRPSDDSIMRNNRGGFNAPSREAIWFRMQKLSNGADWSYNYEEFVSYDAVNRKTSATTAANTWSPWGTKARYQAQPPVLVGKTWKETISD